MSNLKNIINAIENNKNKTLICDIPKELVQGLNIQADGTVDLATLLKICHRVKKSESLKAEKTRHDNIMNLIFNPDIAADFEHKKQ